MARGSDSPRRYLAGSPEGGPAVLSAAAHLQPQLYCGTRTPGLLLHTSTCEAVVPEPGLAVFDEPTRDLVRRFIYSFDSVVHEPPSLAAASLRVVGRGARGREDVHRVWSHLLKGRHSQSLGPCPPRLRRWRWNPMSFRCFWCVAAQRRTVCICPLSWWGGGEAKFSGKLNDRLADKEF